MDYWSRIEVLQELVKALVQTQQWEYAAKVAQTMKRRDEEGALRELAKEAIQMQQREIAQVATCMITPGYQTAHTLMKLGVGLTQIQEMERAVALLTEAEAPA